MIKVDVKLAAVSMNVNECMFACMFLYAGKLQVKINVMFQILGHSGHQDQTSAKQLKLNFWVLFLFLFTLYFSKNK